MALSRKLHFQMPAFQLLKGFIKVFKDSGIQTDFYLKPQKLYIQLLCNHPLPPPTQSLYTIPHRETSPFFLVLIFCNQFVDPFFLSAVFMSFYTC